MRVHVAAAFGLVLLAGAGTAPEFARDEFAVLARRLAAIRRELPRETWDLHALAGSARTDAELCAWLREHLGYLPYAGFQRGASGTLASGSGNAADRALLLAALLRARGVDAELVRGRSPGALPPARAARLPEVAADPARLAALAAAAGVPVERLARAPAEAAVLGAGLRTRLEHRVRRDHRALLAVLDGKVPPPAGAPPPAAAEHWWVRTPAGDLDPTLDPTLEGAPSGGTAVAVDRLPADACQTLRVQCKLRVEGAKEEEDVRLLDVTLRTADLFGEPLALGIMPIDGTAKVAALADPTPTAVIAALAASRSFQPQVATPQRTHSGRAFDLAGNVLPLTDGRVAAAKEIGGKVGGLFGGIAGEDDKKEPAQIAACWFEIELAAPGGEPARVRRDLIRPGTKGAQRVLDLLATRQVLVAGEGFGEDWLTGQFIGYAQGVADLARAQARGTPARLADWRQAPRFPVELHAFVAARSRALSRLAADFPRAMLLHARPLLVAQVTRFLDDASPRMETGIDILHNDVLDLGGAPKTWATSLPLLAGVLDTALEHEVREGGVKAVNTSVLLERALLAGATPKLAAADDLPPPAASELAAGSVACVTFDGSPRTWYRIDRATGSALGLVAFGGGQGTSEYGVVAEIMVQLQEAISFYRDMMLCVAIAVTSPLGGAASSRDEFEKCVWNLICGKILDAATSFTEIEPTWLNVLARKAVSETWNNVCEKLAKKAGIGGKGG